jgi:hypothetical protein
MCGLADHQIAGLVSGLAGHQAAGKGAAHRQLHSVTYTEDTLTIGKIG